MLLVCRSTVTLRGDGEQQAEVMAGEDRHNAPLVVEAGHAGDRLDAHHLDAAQHEVPQLADEPVRSATLDRQVEPFDHRVRHHVVRPAAVAVAVAAQLAPGVHSPVVAHPERPVQVVVPSQFTAEHDVLIEPAHVVGGVKVLASPAGCM